MGHKTRLGPIAVFLMIVTMVITTLAILTVATSNADIKMAERFASVTQTRYELESEAEQFIAAAAAGNADNGYSFVSEKDGYRIEVEITVPDAQGNYEIRTWKLSKIWNADDPINDIWPGF